MESDEPARARSYRTKPLPTPAPGKRGRNPDGSRTRRLREGDLADVIKGEIMTETSTQPVPTATLDQLFFKARTHRVWKSTPISDETLHHLYDVMKWGPTSANSTPARLVFVRSPEAKEKLVACLSPGNVKKVQSAPVTAII